MNNAVPLQPIVASLFHAGNTCPHCQETVVAAQLIVTCPQCGSIHHETCWLNKGGCASYHCDGTVRTNAANLQPDIIINAQEAKNVVVPPPPPRRSAQEVAAAFLPKKPERLSRLAIASSAVAGLSLIGLLGAIAGKTPLTVLGISFALLALVLGVIAMVIINNTENRVHGLPYAAGSVLVPVLLIMVYFGALASHYRGQNMQHADLNIPESIPSKEQLSHMPAPAANAMRANVVIQCSSGLLSATRYGSGIIVRLDKHKAYILTNKHVTGEDTKVNIDVIFYNGEKSKAAIEWLAPVGADIAVIGCQALSISDYKQIVPAEILYGPGEKVFAVGNPMQLAWSYTEGTISGIRKSVSGSQTLDLYQTQTPINSGNSGGGLYTVDGILIGVNTLTQDKSISENLNFALATPGILKLLGKDERARFFGQAELTPEAPDKADKREKADPKP